MSTEEVGGALIPRADRGRHGLQDDVVNGLGMLGFFRRGGDASSPVISFCNSRRRRFVGEDAGEHLVHVAPSE